LMRCHFARVNEYLRWNRGIEALGERFEVTRELVHGMLVICLGVRFSYAERPIAAAARRIVFESIIFGTVSSGRRVRGCS
jgi:hypothetical protein